MRVNMIWFWGGAYLLFCASGFLAVVKYFIMPHWCAYRKAYEDGLDMTWCDIVLVAVFSLIPMFNLSANLFWLWVLRQRIKRRPLIKWPLKGLVAIRGKKAAV